MSSGSSDYRTSNISPWGLLGAFTIGAFAVSSLAVSRPSPFFDGWFIRVVDREQGVSASIIFGSIRLPGNKTFSEHYVCISSCGLGQEGGKDLGGMRLLNQHCFPPAEGTELVYDGIRRDGHDDECDWGELARGGCRDFSWWSHGRGGMNVTDGGGAVTVDFTMPAQLPTRGDNSKAKVGGGVGAKFSATIKGRRAWNEASPNSKDGPEGWLGRTGLLPCHYSVQSLGSSAEYRVEMPGGGSCRGTGVAHVETNYGVAFPKGWCYFQTAGFELGRASLLVTGGMFAIGPVSPLTWIVCMRAPGLEWDFRTTDGHSVEADYTSKGARLKLTATAGRRVLELDARAEAQSFAKQDVWIPTESGFTNGPGCTESFAAEAKIVLKEGGRMVGRWRVPMCALEFGGAFQKS